MEAHNERRLYSPSASVTMVDRAAALVALALAAIAVGVSIVNLVVYAQNYRELSREVRLQQLKLDEYRVALMHAGIDPNPHPPGEQK